MYQYPFLRYDFNHSQWAKNNVCYSDLESYDFFSKKDFRCKLDLITGKGCNSMCNGHGYCVSGQCFCDVAWRGSLCEVQSCPGQYDDCSLHGSCNSATQVCSCNPGKTTNIQCQLYSIPLICLKYYNFMQYVNWRQGYFVKFPLIFADL